MKMNPTPFWIYKHVQKREALTPRENYFGNWLFSQNVLVLTCKTFKINIKRYVEE